MMLMGAAAAVISGIVEMKILEVAAPDPVTPYSGQSSDFYKQPNAGAQLGLIFANALNGAGYKKMAAKVASDCGVVTGAK